MITLIDGDLVAFRCAASAEREGLDIAIYRLNDLFHRILHETNATGYELFLSGSENYRKQVCPEYKAHRTKEPPQYLQDLREVLVSQHKATLADGVEADDEIGIVAGQYFVQDVPFVTASIDKDFRQIAGKHYEWDFSGTTNKYKDGVLVSSTPWVKARQDYFVTPLDAKKYFYKQMLIGDKADNITGVTNIGEVKAARLIDPLTEETDMFDTVYNLYSDKQHFIRNAQLLWILKSSHNPTEVLHYFHSIQRPVGDLTSSSSLISETM